MMDLSTLSNEELLNLEEKVKGQGLGVQSNSMQQNPNDIMQLLKQAQPSGGQSIANAMSVLGGGKPIYELGMDQNKLMNALMIANYKQRLKPLATHKGYAPGVEIPKTMGGLPISGITSGEDGYQIPEYKTPTGQGAFGQYGDQQPQNPQDVYADLNPEDKALIDGILAYKIDPKSAIPGMNNQSRRQVLSLATSLDPTYDMTQFPARAAYIKDFTQGKRSSNILAGNTLIKHMGSLEGSLGNLPSSGIKPYEQLQRGIAKNYFGTGKQAIAMTEEGTSLNAVAGELANVFKQTGSTDPEIESWKQGYDVNLPVEAKKAYIKKGVELLYGRLGAIGSEYERTMGKPYGQSLINPDAQQVIDKIIGGRNFGQSQLGQPNTQQNFSGQTSKGVRYKINA